MADNGWPETPGVPANPQRDGWHWVQDDEDPPVVALWLGGPGFHLWPDLRGASYCYTYLGPCLTPTEQAAAVRAAVLAEREACVAQLQTLYDSPCLGDDTAYGALQEAMDSIRARTTEDPGHG